MKTLDSYTVGLLALMSVLVNSDGEISENELNYLQRIKDAEGIPDQDFDAYTNTILGKSEKEVYQIGMDAINRCSDNEKLNAFARMYHMAQADGVIHVKEVRLLLYAVKTAQVDFNMVMEKANQMQLAEVG